MPVILEFPPPSTTWHTVTFTPPRGAFNDAGATRHTWYSYRELHITRTRSAPPPPSSGSSPASATRGCISPACPCLRSPPLCSPDLATKWLNWISSVSFIVLTDKMSSVAGGAILLRDGRVPNQRPPRVALSQGLDNEEQFVSNLAGIRASYMQLSPLRAQLSSLL